MWGRLKLASYCRRTVNSGKKSVVLSPNPLYCFFGSEDHVALDRNPGPGYNTPLSNERVQCREAFCTILYHFNDSLWNVPTVTRTHDLLG